MNVVERKTVLKKYMELDYNFVNSLCKDTYD